MPLVIDDVLACAAGTAPNRLAVTLGDEAMTFAEVRHGANRMANALLGLGVGRGDRVAWWSDISLDGVLLYFGLGRIATAFVPLNPAYSDEEVRVVLEYLRPRLLIADAAHAARAEAVAGSMGVPLATLGASLPGADLGALADAASPGEPPVPLPGEEDVFTIFLTSGSTGRPKGVMVSHRATWLRTHAGSAAHTTTSGKGELVMFPLFHMAGWNFSTIAWSGHHTAHLVPRADAETLLGAIERWSPGTLYCIPAVWRRILDSDRPTDVSSLEWTLTGTSQVSTELLRDIKERFPNTRTTVNYGSTEMGRAVGLPDEDLFRKPDSVGFPIPGVQSLVAEDGELLLRGERMMSGYFDMPEETAEALAGGWYHTGDLAEVDDEGYLYIVGRKKEIIRSGGESIAPVEVEAALSGFPGLAEVAVIGVPDAEWGEVVCAAVVLSEGAAAPSVEELRRHIGDRLAGFKHPRRVIVVEELPRTSATGQVQRARLAREEASR